MGYINDIGKELEPLLESMPPEDRPAVIKFVKDKILESYRNGLAAKDANPEKRGERRPRTPARMR